jgi:hypothetical protein
MVREQSERAFALERIAQSTQNQPPRTMPGGECRSLLDLIARFSEAFFYAERALPSYMNVIGLGPGI